MVAGDVVLGYFAFVLDLLLGEEVGDVGLLQQGVAFVFFVGEDSSYPTDRSRGPAFRGGISVFFQILGDT